MTHARKSLISLDDTPYYHRISRCVRRAFRWGRDEFSGRDYSHRKQWVLDRLAELQHIFAIDLCAYAVMSNHYHVVLRVDREKAQSWSEDEIVERWAQVFGVPLVVARLTSSEQISDAERAKALELVEVWRVRLYDVSWFMRRLNEYLARRANEEDKCKGRFWEGRFKSQALLDEAGLLTCMSYGDLNPIRAALPRCRRTASIPPSMPGFAQKLFGRLHITRQVSNPSHRPLRHCCSFVLRQLPMKWCSRSI